MKPCNASLPASSGVDEVRASRLRRPHPGVSGPLLVLALAAAATAASEAGGKCAGREADPDCALYVVVRKCLDTEVPGYCDECPLPRTSYCPEAVGCEKTTEVWAGGQRYVALRDASMCSCPQVVHGIVLPLGAVSGIEDPDRPRAIWKFAWDVTVNTALAPEQAALVVASEAHRTQSQLHVHILPLDPERSVSLEATPSIEVPDLFGVWAKADELAGARGIRPYGILVHRKDAGWHVHVENADQAAAYTLLPVCSKPVKKR
jgi:hypothetical protein